MTARDLVGVMEQTLFATLIVGGPIVMAALVVGLIVSIFQAATQINEATLTFVPKLLIVAGILVVMGPSMVGTLLDLTRYVFSVAAATGPVNGG
ncbi:MAG: flagellar biosynthetic protein FliQ [Chloroflexota bacterium]